MARVLIAFVCVALIGGCTAGTRTQEIAFRCPDGTQHTVIVDDRPQTATDWVIIHGNACPRPVKLTHRR